MTLEARKYKLISQITRMENEEEVARLEVLLKNIKEEEALLARLAKPMRKKLDIDTLIQEQNFTGVDRQKFDALVAELDIQEPVEALLDMI